MNEFSFSHLSNDVAWNRYVAAESDEVCKTATTLALLAEVDERKLYLPAGYASMCDYCMHARRMTRDRALKGIRVARAGREFPAIFHAIAEDRLGVSAVLLLVPHLSSATADELLAIASNKTDEGVEQLLAVRFRQGAPQMLLTPTKPDVVGDEVAVRPPVPCNDPISPSSMEPVPVAPVTNQPGWRYAYSAARDQKLRYVQSLLAHAKPGVSVDQLLDIALDCLQEKLEKQKFGKCSRPGKRRGSKNPRYIPLEVKRAVWERDGGQGAFVGTGGKRCDARAPLEFDHVDPVARGGQATVDGIRLLCRAHNQYAAERTFGTDFMRAKREQTRESAARAKARAQADVEARAREEAARGKDVIPWLRELGYNATRARKGADACAHIPDAPLEERVRVALKALAPHCVRWTPQAAGSSA